MPSSSASEPIEHDDVCCDECGATPIIGIRYVATHLYDYDLCSSCFSDHTADRDSFVAFDRPTANASDVCLVPNNEIEASSTKEAAEKIGKNDGTRATTADLSLFPDAANKIDGKLLEVALGSNTNLVRIDILMHSCRHPATLVANIARGIACIPSIKSVRWCIGKENRNGETGKAIRSMVQNSKSLSFLSLNRSCRYELVAPTTDEEKFVTTVFDGLRGNKILKGLRLDSHHKLSEQTKEYLLDIVKENRPIKRVEADFEVEDRRLELLLACNRGKWMERLAQAERSRGMQLDVLAEAMSNVTTEPVPAAYHLLRRFVGICYSTGD